MVTQVCFLVVLFIANVIQAITGFAGTVVAMPPSAYLIGLDSAKVVLNFMAMFSCFFIAWTGRSHIQWKILIKMCLVMLPAMVVGMVICNYIPSEELLLTIYGYIIVAVALKNMCIRRELKLSPLAQYLVLIGAGLVHGLFVSGGALLVIYAVAVLKDKEEFRATVASVWVALNSVLVVSQLQSGGFTPENIQLIMLGLVPLVVAIYVGTKLASKINQTVFLNMVYVLLCISGLSLII